MAKKKQTKLSNAAHIKRHTEGTSNEISFSVLDAAKNRVDVEAGIDSKAHVPRLGGIRLFSWRPSKNWSTPTRDNALPLSDMDHSLPSSDMLVKDPKAKTAKPDRGSNFAAASGASFAEAEIERRKTRRRGRRVFTALMVTVLLIAGIGGGGYFIYNEITTHQSQVSLLDQALDKVTEADKVVVPLDQAINGTLEGKSGEELQAVLNNIPATIQLLDEAEELANEAIADMRDSSDKEAAEEALTAIAARKGMLEAGSILLSADIQATADYSSIDAIWKKVLEADELVREAAAIVVDTTPENVATSIEKSNEALVALGEAESLLYDLLDSSLSPDIQTLIDYVAKRKEALGHSIASDEAILAQDRVIAEEQNEAYNTADAEAATLAKELPEEIGQIVKTAYEAHISEANSQYEEMRAQGSAADAVLRDYLGI